MKIISIFIFLYFLSIIGLFFLLKHKEVSKPVKTQEVKVLTPSQIRTNCYIKASSETVDYRNKLCSLEGKQEDCTLTAPDQADANDALIKLDKACEDN